MNNSYTDIMESTINNKTVLLQFIDYSLPIVDTGCSTGALTFEVAAVATKEETQIVALEPDLETFKELQENVETFPNVIALSVTLQSYLDTRKAVSNTTPLNILLTSVVHHMIKYRNEAKPLFTQLFRDLPKNSRIIIRDGVRPNRADEKIGFICNPKSLKLAKEFIRRFREWHSDLNVRIDKCTIWAPRWVIIEMMLTITWGQESMERECYEHYTILGLEDHIDIFSSIGYKTVYAESIVQNGYPEFLHKLGRLINRNGYEIPLPFTNQILCFIKQ